MADRAAPLDGFVDELRGEARTVLVERLLRIRVQIDHHESCLGVLHDRRADIFHRLNSLGVSWAEIGRLDGITDQAASKHARKRHPRETAS